MRWVAGAGLAQISGEGTEPWAGGLSNGNELEGFIGPENTAWARVAGVAADFFTLMVAIEILVAARLALPFVVREAIYRRLAAIPEYTGEVGRVGVGVWQGRL